MDFTMKNFLGVVCSFSIAALASPNPGGSPVAPDRAAAMDSLDQMAVHEIYSEGDFEGVILAIEAFTSTHRMYSLSDSIFIAKHLAVIYTANPATREKGKNYMFRLLNLMPSAKIVDMFVSDEIDHIFEKIREEYVVRERSLGRGKPSQLESNRYAANRMGLKPDSSLAEPSRNSRERPVARTGKSSHAFYWIAGGATLAAVAGVTYFLVSAESPTDKTYDLPK